MALSKEFLQEQKKKLLEERARLKSELKSIADPSKTKKDDYNARYENMGDDIDTNAFEVYTYEQNLAIERDLENILQKVNLALERLEKGEYDKCEKGDTIEQARLRVIPWATTCIKHSK